MKIINATKTDTTHSYDVWLDEDRVIVTPENLNAIQIGSKDIEVQLPEEDEEGRTLITTTYKVFADPDSVQHFDWGNDISQEQALYEMKLICEEMTKTPEKIDSESLDIASAQAPEKSKTKKSKSEEAQEDTDKE